MKTHLLNFIKQFTSYVLLIAIISYLIQKLFPEFPLYQAWYAILVFLSAFTLFLYWQLAKYFGDRLSKFTNALMLVNFGKMMLYIMIIFVFIWFNRDQALSFSLTFMLYYALITAFEIRALLKLK
jgi:hypothetical protein